jgi:hypothetical protein
LSLTLSLQVTALGDAATLKNISLCVTELHQHFMRNFPDGWAHRVAFEDFVKREFVDAMETKKLFDKVMANAQERYQKKCPAGAVTNSAGQIAKQTVDVLEVGCVAACIYRRILRFV